jgi:short-subunit dehydrogenase
MIDSKKNIVWVTGATEGIGRAIAVEFAKAGHTVICSARRKAKLKSVTDYINKNGGNALGIKCDISKESDVKRTVKQILKEYGRIDALINNAGVTEFKSFMDSSIKDYDNIMNVNLRGSFLCIKEVLPGMIKRKDGQIINILSVAAITTFENSSLYAASKAGLKAMSEGLRKEVRSKGIKVINIMPGATATNMWDKDFLKDNFNRMMTSEDIGRLTLDVFNQPKALVTEDIVVRPIKGDV